MKRKEEKNKNNEEEGKNECWKSKEKDEAKETLMS